MQIKKSSQTFSSKFAALLLMLLIAVFAPVIAHAAVYDAQHVVMTPGTSISQMNFSWYSASNTNSLVQVALKSNMQGTAFPTTSVSSFNCTRAAASSGFYSNKAVAASLSPSTEYVYRLGDGNGNWSPNYFFTTQQSTQFSFLAVGDPQIGAGSTSTDITGWDNTLTKAQAQFPVNAFIMSAGDQVNTNNNETQFAGFFSPSEIKNIPVVPALGNHDNGAPNTGYHFNLPNLSTQYGVTSPGSADYYYTYGNALFMIINSNNTSGTSHRTFIQNAVAANPNVTWKIVMFHHDIYGSGSHALESSVQNLRAALFPIFDQYGIDIVITGHDHSYTRTHVLKGDVPQLNQTYDANGAIVNPTGTIYFTLNSASGSKYYSLNASQANYVAVRSQINVPTFSRVTINGSSLTFDTYRTDTMARTDTCSIVKNTSAPTPTPSPTPTPTLTPTPTPTTGSNVLEKRVSSDMDDVEEKESGGTIYTDSTDLEMVYDSYVGGDQIIGLRFTNISIPKGATITKAYIQFTCDETSTGAAGLTIKGQSTDNAAAFTTAAYNVSARSATSASVTWAPPEWNTVGEAGTNQRTSDIKNVIQEIVNRGGWVSGNSMVITVTGNDGVRRCAVAYKGNAAQAPLLHIEYTY